MSDPQRFICIHGHFYQPPRENAWLETVEVQDSAAPYHDWNERIDRECYAANGSARILSPDGRIARIVNNYSRISFNFGPTLLSWMEKEAPIAYRRVLEGDRASMEQFGGHGSAIAQVYNHVIMPLATTEDRVVQIRWGIADFEHRFQRKPEGMWLAETAVDLETLDLLAQHGILFTILAPHQCARVRAIPVESDPEAPPWQETPEASVDPTQPYLIHTAGGRSIAVFFYDGPISRAIAFNGLLNDGHHLAEQLLHGFRDNGRPGQLVHVATDGESYGHHHPHGDMALAYALHSIERNGDAQLTNYGQFLEMFPPTYEAEIRENTSWSCSHGLERWRADCGCGRTGAPGSNQQWRTPLRAALDGLRDSAQPLIRDSASKWLREGEAGLQSATHAYIHVLLDRTTDAQQSFLDAFAKRPFGVEDQVNILKLMEFERHLQLMYTSCGWFFDDLAGIEPVQVISYAGRALELAEQLFGAPGADLASAFLARIAEAHANGPEHMTGEEIYLQSVASKSAELKQACARYAIVSLFEPPPEKTTQYCYEIRRKSFEILTSGRGRFAYGQAEICSRITWECGSFDFAVLHLGDQNLSAAVRPTGTDGNSFAAFAEEIRGAVTQADLPEAMRLFRRDFGSIGYSLSSLIRDDQRRILQILLDSTLAKMTGALRAIYEDHVSLLRYLSLTRVPKPNALILAAQYTLNADLCKALSSVPFDAFRVRQLLAQTLADQLALDARSLSSEASRRMLRAMIDFENHLSPNGMEEAIEILDTIRELPLDVDLWEAQNIWHSIFRRKRPGKRTGFESDRRFRELGEKLGMDIERLCAEG
jgi:alpha-amylase/alpha-mannosidase (GH57 family)